MHDSYIEYTYINVKVTEKKKKVKRLYRISYHSAEGSVDGC